MTTPPTSSFERNRSVRRVLAVILVLNWIVAGVKILVGLLSQSASITADGMHSFIDGSSNVLGLIAMGVASRPADENHPYGHGKFEALASLGIGAMVGVGMLELGRMAFDALLNNHHPTVSKSMAVVMIGTLLLNIGITYFERRAGKRLRSPLLLADAKHTLSDVIVSTAVLLSIVLVWLGVPRADGAVALVVLAFVAYVAYGIIKQSVGILADEAMLPGQEVATLASQVEGVRASSHVRSRGMEGSVYVDLKVFVDPLMTTRNAHQLADRVEDKLLSTYPQIIDVVVHVEPDLESTAPRDSTETEPLQPLTSSRRSG